MSEQHWSKRREGGGYVPIWLIMKIGLLCGRNAARMLLYPITLGGGKKLLPEGKHATFVLKSAKAYPSGVVGLHYERKAD